MKKVFVGMSGGVDSSLTAALLVEKGFHVTGVYMKNWSQDLPGMKCPWTEDLADAKRVAVRLGIDFRVYDFEETYREKVVGYMIEQYKMGVTPNPDIMCNQEVKFKVFLEMALEDGADMIATGHYAKCVNGELLMAEDSAKDQTYFLYRVTHQALEKTLFPLGEFTKPEVRKMAAERGLITADKKDSQGICFVGSVGIREFLSQYVKTEVGDIVDKKSNKKLGEHDGAIFYTLGQRHGLNLGGGLPYYVVDKNMDKNIIYVSRDLNDNSMWQTSVKVSNIHYIRDEYSKFTDLKVRFRHRGELKKATLIKNTLLIDNPERAVSAGQSAVFYKDGVCLGGGIVCS